MSGSLDDEEVTFVQLAARLAGSPLSGTGTAALSVRTPETFYVHPCFTVTQRSTDSPVVLLSARGAGGKSATANALSERLGAPVWRLQDDAAVSQSSVHSTLVQHLGVVNPFEVLRNGSNPLIIIDSLDEARSRVSSTSWSEFVQAVIEAVRAGLRVVFLGRTRTLLDLWATLEDCGVQPDWYEVSHLDDEGRVEYVDQRVRLRRPTSDVGNAAYRAARDAVIQALRAPLSDDEVPRFLGYPPVLDAVAALLVENQNHIALQHEFSVLNVHSRSEVLRRILDEILRREQGKLAPLAHDLGLEAAAVYRPEEQVQWLLHDIEAADRPDCAGIGNAALRQKYQERLALFRHDHPFRSEGQWASPVFQAHVLSMAFDTAPADAVLRAGDASGLLFELVSGRVARGELIVTEAQMAALHASLLAGQWRDADAAVTLGGLDGWYSGEFILDSSQHPLEFILAVEHPHRVVLRGPLTELTVNVDGEILVRSSSPDVVLGPDLHLSGQTVRIEGDHVAFGLRDGEQGGADVTIIASELRLPPVITPPIPRPGSIEIVAPAGLPYPWSDHQASPDDLPDAFDERAVRLLNKLMALTRVHGHKGDRAVYVKKLEGRQGLPPEKFKASLSVLEGHQVIYLKGQMIFYSEAWEPHRYHGKTAAGMRSLADCLDAWRPVLRDLSAVI